MEPLSPTPRAGESPFLPGTCIQFAWDSHSLSTYKTCPRKYQLSIIEGWRHKRTGYHLKFGIHFTDAVDRYDKLRADGPQAGLGHEEALRTVVGLALIDTWETYEDGTEGPWISGDPKNTKTRYTLIRSIVWYLDQFGERDPARTLVLEDGRVASELSFRYELDWGPLQDVAGPVQPYVLCGHLDRVCEFTGETFIMDRKTTGSTVGDYYFDQYEPNNQITFYTVAGQIILGTLVKGVIIDAVQTAVGFSRFARGVTYRTQAQLSEWLRDLQIWLEQAEKDAMNRYWPMNDTACFGCEFNRHDGKICAKDPAVRQSFLEANFTQESPWNPLQTR